VIVVTRQLINFSALYHGEFSMRWWWLCTRPTRLVGF